MTWDDRLWTASARRGAVTHLPGLGGHTACTRSMRTGVRLTAEEAAEIEAKPCDRCAEVSARADEFWDSIPEDDPNDTRTVEDILNAAWRELGEYYDPTPADPSPVDGAGVGAPPAVATADAPTGVGETGGTGEPSTALSERVVDPAGRRVDRVALIVSTEFLAQIEARMGELVRTNITTLQDTYPTYWVGPWEPGDPYQEDCGGLHLRPERGDAVLEGLRRARSDIATLVAEIERLRAGGNNG